MKKKKKCKLYTLVRPVRRTGSLRAIAFSDVAIPAINYEKMKSSTKRVKMSVCMRCKKIDGRHSIFNILDFAFLNLITEI